MENYLSVEKYALKFGQSKELTAKIMEDTKVSKHLESIYNYSQSTFGHSIRVALLCAELAIQNKLPQRQIDLLVCSGLLHDTGKIGIPKELLNKPSGLLQKEKELVDSHALIGARKIENFNPYLSRIIGNHHTRRMDHGSNHNLTDILRIADIYDALRSERSYKSPMTREEAAAIMLNQFKLNPNYTKQIVTR